jgi:hypothetical protein
MGLNLVYRGAYGLAHAEVERSRYSRDQVHGKDPAAELARMVGRITHELGKTDGGRDLSRWFSTREPLDGLLRHP